MLSFRRPPIGDIAREVKLVKRGLKRKTASTNSIARRSWEHILERATEPGEDEGAWHLIS
jgi:hypothetical protein